MRWHETLKARLLIPMIGVLFLSMTASLTWLYFVEKEKLLNRTSRETALVSEVIKAGIRNQMLKNFNDMTQASIALIQKKTGLKEVSLINKDGSVAYSSREDSVGLFINRDSETCRICHMGEAVPEKQTVVLNTEDGSRIFRSVNPIENEKECRKCHTAKGNLLGVLIVDQFIGRALMDIRKVQKSLFTVGAVTLLVLIGVIFMVVELLVQRPINTLMEGTRRIESGDFHTKIQVGVKGEMNELAGSFNSMVGSIENYIGEIEEKSYELSTLYSMVERITRTIDLDELRRIVLEIIMEAFTEINQGIIVFRLVEEGNVDLFSRKVGEIKIMKKTFDPHSVEDYRNYLNPRIMEQWLSKNLNEATATDGESGMLIPLISKGRNFGFLHIRKKEGETFSGIEKKLIHALGSHISISLENARLYTIAITDELTKAYTLRYFQQKLEYEIGRYQRYGQKVSLLILDLDDFKGVNDNYGHTVGDGILREFVNLSMECIRGVDIFCRYGGEEFAAILPEADQKAAMVVAERIRSRTEEKVFFIDGNEIKITVSVGVATCPTNALTVRDLVNASDSALYKAKEMGKNRVESH